MPRKTIARRLHPALVATMLTVLTGGIVHLLVTFITAFTQHNIVLVNPINFMGLASVFPTQLDSATVTIMLWVGLFALGFAFLGILTWLKLSLYVRQKPTDTTEDS